MSSHRNLMNSLNRLPVQSLPTQPTGNGPVLWRLAYADGSYVTEPAEGASIRLAKRGAIALQLITRHDTPHGQGIMSVALRPGERPIFYRRRSADALAFVALAQHPEFGPDAAQSAINWDAVVYGAARDGGDGSSRLWAILRGATGIQNPVPRQHLDAAMIKLQFEG